MTSDKVWHPTYADNDVDPYDPSFVDNTSNELHLLPHDKCDLFGEYTAHTASNLDANINCSVEFDDFLPNDLFPTIASNLEANGSAEFDEFTSGELFEDAIPVL